MQPKMIIGVIGAGQCSEDVGRLAEAVGRAIARRNHALICGGLSGVMEHACRGARAEGGLTIGVLPGFAKSDANPYVDIAIATGMSEARNIIIVRSSDAVIAVGGEYGTLSELAFCLKFGVPVVGLQSWEAISELPRAESPEAAVEMALKLIKQEN